MAKSQAPSVIALHGDDRPTDGGLGDFLSQLRASDDVVSGNRSQF
jgi:hypothetical protein